MPTTEQCVRYRRGHAVRRKRVIITPPRARHSPLVLVRAFEAWCGWQMCPCTFEERGREAATTDSADAALVQPPQSERGRRPRRAACPTTRSCGPLSQTHSGRWRRCQWRAELAHQSTCLTSSRRVLERHAPRAHMSRTEWRDLPRLRGMRGPSGRGRDASLSHTLCFPECHEPGRDLPF